MGWVVNATPRPLYPWERQGTHCIGGWVGQKAGLDVSENHALTGIWTPDRRARSESLYRLNYPGPYLHIQINNIVENLNSHDEKPSEKPWPHTLIDSSLLLFFFPKHKKSKTSKTRDCLRGWIMLHNTHLCLDLPYVHINKLYTDVIAELSRAELRKHQLSSTLISSELISQTSNSGSVSCIHKRFQRLFKVLMFLSKQIFPVMTRHIDASAWGNTVDTDV